MASVIKDPRQVILGPVITERSFDLMETNKYTFKVAKQASKIEIAKAVQDIFDVTVLKVNTLNVKSKPKRVRYQLGRTRTWKKAIVTLAAGDTIEAFGA
ncbi:MAG: 50S ribosomal protein L23 [Coriobacteriales bacterium]|jgi:large subunit ribosomal protein L23|nr:50S ribosomal protein L23 [Coriobacteriales bacterium]